MKPSDSPPASEAVRCDDLFALCWSNNCRGAANDALYVMHAYQYAGRTKCGVQVQEVGEQATADEIGCKRCLAVIAREAKANAEMCHKPGGQTP